MAEIGKDTVISGRYRLLAKLGRGGMGAVWRAEHEELRVPVAVKLLLPELVESAEARKRFKREAQAAADLSLSTKHVVQVLDHGIDQGVPFIAMELLPGEDLAQRLARVGRLEPVALCSVLSQVGRAIALAHARGIVHRDLKPANIFLTQDRDTGQELVKVLDFGIARFESHGLDTSSVETVALVGTPLYMSPEQLSLGLRVDARSDVWAFGVIAFEALTGKHPLHAVASDFEQLTAAIREARFPVPLQVAPVASGFEAWFRQAVARDRDERFQSMAAAVNALMHACGVVEDRVSVPGGSRPPEGAVDGSTPGVVGDTVQAPGAGKATEGAVDGSTQKQQDTHVHVTGAPSSHSVGPTVEPRRGPRRGVWLVAVGTGALLALAVWWLRSEEAPAPAAREESALVRVGAEPRGSASAAEVEVAPVVSVERPEVRQAERTRADLERRPSEKRIASKASQPAIVPAPEPSIAAKASAKEERVNLLKQLGADAGKAPASPRAASSSSEAQKLLRELNTQKP